MTFFVIVIFIGFLWVNHLMNHIPATGRDGDAQGEIITAVITNSPKAADRSATMRAAANGRKFKVKMKPTEAHLWIKGDSVRIILSENKQSYRIMFGEYFRENESRLRDRAVELLEKKVSRHLIAARLTGYTKKSFEAIKASKLESQRIFAFVSFMRMLESCTLFTAVAAFLFLVWCAVQKPGFTTLLIPLVSIVVLIWMLYNTCETCKNIIKQAA